MIDHATGIVAHGGANVFGNGVQVADQIGGTFTLQVGMLLQRGVQVVGIGLMMLVVVNLHRLFVDVRFERVVRVRQWINFVGHDGVSPVE